MMGIGWVIFLSVWTKKKTHAQWTQSETVKILERQVVATLVPFDVMEKNMCFFFRVTHFKAALIWTKKTRCQLCQGTWFAKGPTSQRAHPGNQSLAPFVWTGRFLRWETSELEPSTFVTHFSPIPQKKNVSTRINEKHHKNTPNLQLFHFANL